MAKLIRRDGQTVNAYEDAVAFDYAFAGQSGVVANVMNEMESDTTTLNQFKIKSGMAVIQGRQFIIETEEILQLQQAVGSTEYYYIVYAEIDMSAVVEQDGMFYNGKVTFKTGSWPNAFPPVPDSDDLNANPNGVARLLLYRFRQTSSGVVGLEKMFEIINTGTFTNAILKQGYSIPNNSIPTNRIQTIAELTGDFTNIVQQSGTLSAGWYEINLAAGGGGGGSYRMGGQGGKISSIFFVPYSVNYKLMAGGGGTASAVGTNSADASGGGGGGSVLDIPQLGILFIATGGGGGGAEGVGGGGSTGRGTGGGGGGYGGGGARYGATGTSGGYGGAGGGNYGGINDGGGAGGGRKGLPDSGGLSGGSGGKGANVAVVGAHGGNNLSTSVGLGGLAGALNANGGNGYAHLYKLS